MAPAPSQHSDDLYEEQVANSQHRRAAASVMQGLVQHVPQAVALATRHGTSRGSIDGFGNAAFHP
jgi:hypothetical protein